MSTPQNGLTHSTICCLLLSNCFSVFHHILRFTLKGLSTLLHASFLANFKLYVSNCSTHSVQHCFEKLIVQKNTKIETLNEDISKARTNWESRIIFLYSSFDFLQNNVIFSELFPRGYTSGGTAPYQPQIHCQQVAGLKGLLIRHKL